MTDIVDILNIRSVDKASTYRLRADDPNIITVRLQSVQSDIYLQLTRCLSALTLTNEKPYPYSAHVESV